MIQANNEFRPRPEKIHALTSLRFFAAFWVVLFHTLFFGFGNLRGTLVERFVSLGFMSVSFFFLLSGYILAMVYLAQGAPVQKKKFYVARFARIYPLFFVTLLADLPFVLDSRASLYGWTTSVAKTIGTLAMHLLMLQAWLPWLRGIDQPNWSLSVETAFYAIFPFLGVALWKLRGAKLWFLAAALWIGNQAAVMLISPYVSRPSITFFPLLHISTFAMGILLARWQVLNRQAADSRPPRWSGIALALLFASAALAATVYWQGRLPSPNINAGLLAPVFALVIWAFTGNQGLHVRLLSANWLVILGEASFGLYLIHIPVSHLFQKMGWETSRALYPVYLSLCIGLSIVSFYFLEIPARKWILRRFDTRSRETIETASDAQ
jgi:peptidoglycan/LPS O-acetylase OafA/YrhL